MYVLGEDESPPPSQEVPGDTIEYLKRKQEAEDAAARERLMTIVHWSLAGGVAVALGLVLWSIREPASRRYHKRIRPGDTFCRSGVRYRMAKRSEKVYRVGNC